MRQEEDEADSFGVFAVLFVVAVGFEVPELLGWLVLVEERLRVRDQVGFGPAAVVVLSVAGAPGCGQEGFDGWVASDSDLRTNLFVRVLGAIDLSPVDIGQGPSRGVPFWLQSLTVTAPRRIELHHPDSLTAVHLRSEVASIQHHNLPRAASLPSLSLLLLLLPSLSLLLLLLPSARIPKSSRFRDSTSSINRVVNDGSRISLSLIISRLVLVIPEELQSREALDPVRRSRGLMLRHIHGGNVHNPFQAASGLFPLWGQILAMAAPRGCC